VPDTGGKPAQVGRIWISGAHLASGYICGAAPLPTTRHEGGSLT